MESQRLNELINAKAWEEAIKLLEDNLKNSAGEMYSYISLNYFLMNLLVEEDYDNSDHDFYAALLKKYFDKAYAKYSDNPDFLFYTAITAFMSEWYFGLDIEDAKQMLMKAYYSNKEKLTLSMGILYIWK